MLLQADNLSRTWRRGGSMVHAVAEVSLTAQAGSVVTIQGPSGSGKTTLLLMLGALLRPTAGTVRIADEDPYAMSAERRSRFRARSIGFVFQRFHLIPYLSVLENVLTPTLAIGIPAARGRAGELIERIGLTGRIDHKPSELSTGECQRVALARAMLGRPRLLLADEPTGNLDAASAAIVLEHLRLAASDGATVVIASHDAVAARSADQRLRLDGGRLAMEGTEMKT